jgi:prevent-host-death family protein
MRDDGMIQMLSSRKFNQDTGRAKKAAEKGPVIVTDRGKPSHVLLSFNEYQKLTGKTRSLADALSMPESDEIEFEPVKLGNELLRPVDFD